MTSTDEDLDDALNRLALPDDREKEIRLLSNATGSEKAQALYWAALPQNEVAVDFLLENGVDINILDESLTPPVAALARAAWYGEADVVKLLINRNAQVNTPGQGYGMTAFQAAVQDGYTDTIALMMNAGVNVNEPLISDRGRTAIQSAVGNGNIDLVKRLLDKGAYIDAPAAEINGRTALQAAAENGNLDMVKFLVNKQAKINAPAGANNGRTALQATAEREHVDMVEQLIYNRADVNAPAAKTNGKTALRAAVDRGGDTSGGGDEVEEQEEEEDQRGGADDAVSEIKAGSGTQKAPESKKHIIVRMLLEAGASIYGTEDDQKQNVLHTICQRGDIDDVALLELLLNPPPSQESQSTAAEVAVRAAWKDLPSPGKIVDSSGSPWKTDETRQTSEKEASPLVSIKDIPRQWSKQETLRPPGDITNTSRSPLTPDKPEPTSKNEKSQPVKVSGASGSKSKEYVTEPYNQKDIRGSTPLHIAVWKKYTKAVELLLKKGVKLNIKNISHKTALEAYFPDTPNEIITSLLAAGASINGLDFDHLNKLLEVCGNKGVSSNIVILCEDAQKGTSVAPSLPAQFDVQGIKSPSILFWNPKPPRPITSPRPTTAGQESNTVDTFSVTDTPVSKNMFVYPSYFLKEYPNLEDSERGVYWAWSPLTQASCGKFEIGLPDTQDTLSGQSCAAIIAAYVPLQYPTVASKEPFDFIEETVEISWLMKREMNSSIFRCVHYRSTLQLKSLVLPNNALEFVDLLFIDICGRWKLVIKDAKDYLVAKRGKQLVDAGTSQSNIDILLKMSQVLSKLHQLYNSTNLLLIKLVEDLGTKFISTERWDFRKDAMNEAEADEKKKRNASGKQAALAGGVYGPESEGMPTWQDAQPPPSLSTALLPPTTSLRTSSDLAEQTGHTSVLPTQGAVPGISIPLQHPNRQQAESIRPAPVGQHEEEASHELAARDTIIGDNRMSTVAPGTKAKEPKIAKQTRNPEPAPTVMIQVLKVDGLKKGLLGKIKRSLDNFKKECEDGIEDLEQDTKAMIELEFNLCSIYEARRSIEASVSMKRLSWITFIFLPLMFVSGAFGMNVNLLQAGGIPWQWYFVVTVPFSIIVIFIWILCKYIPKVGHIEEMFDGILRNFFEPGKSKTTAESTANDSKQNQKTLEPPLSDIGEQISAVEQTSAEKSKPKGERLKRFLTNPCQPGMRSRKQNRDLEEAGESETTVTPVEVPPAVKI